MRYFLAGGAIRDLLLGLKPTEFDIVFDGSAEDLARLHGTARHVGKASVTYIVDGRDHAPLAGSIPEDLLARDCTINALLLGEDGVVYALPQTFDDLRNGVIRHAAPDSFLRDPVRVFRAARFAATLPGFHVAPETVSLMRKTARDNNFRVIAAERVGKECMKALAGHAPGTFLQTLSEARALSPWFSPLDRGQNIPAGPLRHHGHDSVLDHTRDVMNAIAAMPLPPAERPLAVWMGLCHDLGKAETEPEKLPRHIGHESRGAVLARELSRRLRLPRLWEKAGSLAASLHMKAGQYPLLRPGTKVDLLQTLAASRLADPFIALVVADSGEPPLRNQLQRDLETILTVSLPEKWRGRGRESAAELRRLRITALQRFAAGKELDP